jgi:hypothetical protein
MTKEELKEALQEQADSISAVRRILEPAINSLMPIHATLDVFEKGGATCRKAIAMIYERLLQAERTIEDGYYYYYDDDD